MTFDVRPDRETSGQWYGNWGAYHAAVLAERRREPGYLALPGARQVLVAQIARRGGQ